MSENHRIDVAVTIAPLEAADGAAAGPTGAILSNLPPAAVPSAGFPCGDGTWLLNGGDLDGLTVSVPSVHACGFRPEVSAVYQDPGGQAGALEAPSTGALPVEWLTGGAAECGAIIPLDLSAALVGLDDGDQVYDVTVTGVPAGARLSAGADNGNGAWTLLPDQLHGVGLVLPRGSAGAVTLAFCAIGVGPGGEMHTHNAVADVWTDGEAADGISFGPGLGRSHFVGRGGGRDVVHLVGVAHGPSDEITGIDDWKLVLDDPRVRAMPNGNSLRFDREASGSIVLGDGNELSFVDVTRIDWQR